jgi:hypothetical protein
LLSQISESSTRLSLLPMLGTVCTRDRGLASYWLAAWTMGGATVAAQRVVVNQGQVDFETLRHGGLGKPRSDTIVVRVIGDFLADLGPVRRAMGILAVG